MPSKFSKAEADGIEDRVALGADPIRAVHLEPRAETDILLLGVGVGRERRSGSSLGMPGGGSLIVWQSMVLEHTTRPLLSVGVSSGSRVGRRGEEASQAEVPDAGSGRRS